MIRPVTQVVLAFALAWPAAARAERYTVDALLTRLGKEAPAVIAARATLAMREAQLLEQQLRWLPDGDGRLTLASAPNVRCIDTPFDANGKGVAVDPDVGARGNNCIRTNVVDLVRSAPGFDLDDRAPFAGPLLNFGVGLRQPLFTSMKIESAIQAAKGGVGTEVANVRTATLDLQQAAARLFYQVKTARASVATVEIAMGMVRDWQARIEHDLEGENRSHYTESDLLRMRIQAVNLRTTLLDQQRNQRAAEEALRALTGDPQAEVDDSELEWDDRAVADAAAWRERMLVDRPEVQYGRAGLRYYIGWRRLQLGWALPDVALITNLSYGYSPTFDLPNLGYANLPASALGGGVGFVLRQPLDLGPKIAHYRAIDREMAMQESRWKLGLGWWALEVDKAWLDLDEARRRLEQNRRAERVTQGWYASVDENVALGLYADGRELVEVILNWEGFRLRRLQATADALNAMASLRRLAGQPILDEGRP
jgi:outer membrane protein TolC